MTSPIWPSKFTYSNRFLPLSNMTFFFYSPWRCFLPKLSVSNFYSRTCLFSNDCNRSSIPQLCIGATGLSHFYLSFLGLHSFSWFCHFPLKWFLRQILNCLQCRKQEQLSFKWPHIISLMPTYTIPGKDVAHILLTTR